MSQQRRRRLTSRGIVLARDVSRAARVAHAAFEALESRQLLANSIWAFPGADGKMLYQPLPQGDKIEDYSNVGYMGGTVPLPNASVKATVSAPVGDVDATSLIQNAINQVAALPQDVNGIRGTVFLNPGTYRIDGVLNINASGVVLRGAGPNQTILRASTITSTAQRTLININGSNTQSTSNTTNVSDKYVPVGSISFTVDSVAGFNVGDTVIIHRPSTQQWINDMGMNLLDNPWTPGSKDINMDRTITHIDGNVITVDAPITQALDKIHAYGGGTIYKYTAAGRLSNVGVEGIGSFSDYDPTVVSGTTAVDENHPWTFINVDGAINSWVRDVSSRYYAYSCVYVTNSKWVTVQDSQCLDPVSLVTGGRRYSFNIDGSQNVLFKNLYTRDGRHDFVEGSTVTGPNVFVDSRADSTHADIGPHHRYSTGALWDNIKGGSINIQDRGNSGTGHGHAGANQVIWNSTAGSFIVQSPIAAQNWLIGSNGTVNAGGGVGFHTPGLIDQSGSGAGHDVATRSLYYQQLGEKMTVENWVLRETRLGDSDLLTSGDAADAVSVDATWKSNIQTATGKTAVNFDVSNNGQLVPMTFNLNLDPGTHVVGASLSLGVKSTGGSTSADRIYFEDKSRSYTWSQLGVAAPTATQTGVVIDLSKLLAALQDGKLNVAVAGNTAIDWATLTFQTASTTQPTTTTLAPAADASVRDGTSAGSNFGTATTLQTKNDVTNNNQESYLKFDLSSIAGNITGATLRLVPTSVGYHPTGWGSGIGAMFNTISSVSNDGWTETGINWNNKPGSDPAFETFLSYANAPLLVDVTSLVRAAQAGDKTLSLRIQSIVTSASGQISFASRENGTVSLRPQLILTTYNGVTPSADAYVRDGSSATTNFGTAPDLEIKKDTAANSGNNREAYLKFDLNGISSVPAGATVRLVPIWLSATNKQDTAALASTDSWTESGINWNNKPASGATLGSWLPQQAAPGKFDVTSALATELAGDKLLSVRLLSNTTSTGVNNYASREYPDGQLAPLLVLKNLAPMLTSVQDVNGVVNTPTAPIWFGIWDAETAANALSVTVNSSNPALLPNGNITLSGAGVDRFISLTPAANQSGSSNVTLTVTDAQGATAQYTFKYVIANTAAITGDQDFPGENDVVRIVRNGSFVDVILNSITVLHTDYASLASLNIDTLAGNDQITIDYVNGDPIPAGGVTLNGGSGADSLFVAGSTASAATLNLTLAGSGTMSIGAGSVALPALTDLTLTAGETLNLNGQSQTIDSFFGDGTVLNNVAANTSTLTVGQLNGDGNFTGTLTNGSGTLNFAKSGSGVLALNGNNSYTGTTFINGGTLESGNPNSVALLSGPLFFNGGRFHVTASMSSANVNVKYSTSFTGATGASTGTFDVDAGVTLTIGTVGGSASLRTNGGGAHGGFFTKTGDGTLRILSGNGQQDDVFHLDQGTVTAEAATALGGGDSGVRVDMKDGTTLVLKQDGSTSFLTPIRVADAGGEVNVIVDRQTPGAGVTHAVNALTSAGAFTLDVTAGPNITAGTAGLTITNSTTLSGNGIFSVLNSATASTVLTTGPVSGAFAIDKIDNGTMILSGANTYTGATTIENGVLRLGAAGTLPTGTNLTLGNDTDAGTLDLSGHSASVNSITASGDNAIGNKIVNLNAGQTLSVTGVSGANAILVGGLSGADNVVTKLILTGGGALTVNSLTGTIVVDNDAINSASTHEATLDLSGLGNFTANVASLSIGLSPAGNPRPRGVLTLAGSNDITTPSITIARSAGNAGGGSQLNLGQTNTIHANSILIGAGKGSSGSMQFRSGLVNSTLTLTDSGSGVGTDLTLANKTNTGTAGTFSGVADLSAGTINATLHNVVLGLNTIGNDQANGTLTIGPGTVTIASVMLGQASVAGTAAGTLNLNGGTVTINGDVSDGGGSSALALNGASLNMTNHAIGSAANPIDSTTFASGTLANVASINGTGGLTKTTAGTLLLIGSMTYTGPTLVNGGTLRSNTSIATSTGVTVASAGATFVAGVTQRLAALTVNDGGLAQIAAGGDKVLTVGSLSVATNGMFDLTDNDAIIDYTGPSPINQLRGQIATGRAAGAWNGAGINTSVAAANPAAGYAIGYGEASDLGLTTFDGQSVDSTAVLLKFTYGGDANLDGFVDVSDLGRLATGWQTSQSWIGGDFNYDGFVDVGDLGILATNWQKGVGAPLVPAARTVAAKTATTTMTRASVFSTTPVTSSATTKSRSASLVTALDL